MATYTKNNKFRIRSAAARKLHDTPRGPRGRHTPAPTHRKKLSAKEIKRRQAVNKRFDGPRPPIDSAAEDKMLMFFSGFGIKNGAIQNISLAPRTARIQEALDLIEQQGIIPPQQFKISPNEIAENFLFGINSTLSNEKWNFSLLDNQTDKEEIENTNILDRREYTNLRQGYIKTPEKFFDACDPFYNLDDRSTRAARKNQQLLNAIRKPYLLRIASNLSVMNLRTKETNRLRYFMDIKELRKRGKF